MAIHVALTRRVIPGCERAFEDSLREFFQESLGHEGVLGVHLLSPPPGSTDVTPSRSATTMIRSAWASEISEWSMRTGWGVALVSPPIHVATWRSSP